MTNCELAQASKRIRQELKLFNRGISKNALCERMLEAYEAILEDESKEMPNCAPLSILQIRNIIESELSKFPYGPNPGESELHFRTRFLMDRTQVEGLKRDLLWKFVELHPNEDAVRFRLAEKFADDAHIKQSRDSGEPYVIHPLAVADIILDAGMDSEAAITGLLHDTVEDNAQITIDDVANLFGENVAALVDGVTKITKAGEKNMTKEQQQAETIRKMFVAMAKDMRVIPIKLCDRLHNMRTLEYCASNKRVRKAKETLEIYAPLAHRLGMGQVKCELEDLAFMHIDPDRYQYIKKLLDEKKRDRQGFLESAMLAIENEAKKKDLSVTLNGRPKHIYSINRKMIKQNCTIDQIYDLIALRVIIKNSDCFSVLGVVHGLWPPVPGRVKDYISVPKVNMYRSLHTTVLGEKGIPFEVQIRTEEMHKMAEYGIAAHWKYKEGRSESNDLDIILGWMRNILDENSEDATSMMEVLKYDFFSDYVFVYTPQNEIIDLAAGSCPIDFAYKIHSQVGNRCCGAIVNGRSVKLDYVLQMGDVVNIKMSNKLAMGPSRDWLNIVKTQQAKIKIKQWFKKELKAENIERGQDMLRHEAKKMGYAWSALCIEEEVPVVFRRLSILCLDDLYAAVGYGSMTTSQVIPRLIEEYKTKTKNEETRLLLEEMQAKANQKLENKQKKKQETLINSNSVIVKGESGMVTRLSKCCSPVPGDDIVGYITRGRGVSVHRADCSNISNMADGEYRFTEVSWAKGVESKGTFTAHLRLIAMERQGIVMDINKLFVNMNIPLNGLSAKQDKHQGTHIIIMDFDVSGFGQLEHILGVLRKIRGVTDVVRIQS